MLDARIASALNKIIQNSRKPRRRTGFLRGRQIAFMIYDFFRVTAAHCTVVDHADLFSVTLGDDNVQEFDSRRDEVLLLFHVKDTI